MTLRNLYRSSSNGIDRVLDLDFDNLFMAIGWCFIIYFLIILFSEMFSLVGELIERNKKDKE